ncbi:hypothetical protein CCAX7_006880 [Capsulimonas corticalis]|uniref:Uncharacterized protein n=1 Tax=Capsulimonas corticalis TaxID=2219043 RepID=A0A402D1H7_9BACT|nr:RNA polymerase sigma factor [Capsulimonas corticalis]BDI28637.1 hypothetical protein CCAX7_006880 [Capsulimonas corticalis]
MSLREANRIRKYRNGDQAAFREIYDQYAPRVMGYLIRLTGDRADAEDMVQEVFVAAYQGRAGFGERASMLTWLLGIATRRWRDKNRKQTLRFSDPADTDESLDSLPQTGSPLESRVIAAIALDDALEQLAPEYREALLLVAGQGLTYAEAAAITGEPVGTVKWRVSVATRKLQQLLSAEDQEEPHGVPTHRP